MNGQELPYAEAFATLSKAVIYSAVIGETTFTIALANTTDLDDLKSLAPTGTASVSFTYDGGASTFDQTCTIQSYVVAGPTVTFTLSSAAWAGTSSASVSITIVPNGSRLTTVGPFTMPITCVQLWWNTAFLRGLRVPVTIRAEWWKIDDAGAEVSGTRQHLDTIYSADTYDQRFFTTKVTPAAGSGRYRIQFQRLSLILEDTGADVAKIEDVYAVRHFPTKTLKGVTAMRVTTKATLSATGFSDRKFNLYFARHVRGLTSVTKVVNTQLVTCATSSSLRPEPMTPGTCTKNLRPSGRFKNSPSRRMSGT